MALDGTYNGLIASAADWLHRTDLTNLLPDLVTLTEECVNNGDTELDIPALRTSAQEVIWTSASTVPATAIQGNHYVSLPADYLKMRQLYVIDTAGVKQEIKRGGTIPLFQADRANINGLPQWYYEVQGQLYLIPSPDRAYQLAGIYYGAVPSLQVNSTNWLMKSYPRVYLFGVCMYAAPWLGTDNRIQLWGSGFKSGVKALNKMDKRKRITDELARTEVSDVLAPGPYNIYTGLYI